MSDTYLTPKELGIIIKFSTQAIYNLIHKGTFINGIHYYKPSSKKILFKLSAIQKWIEGNESNNCAVDIADFSIKQKVEIESMESSHNNKVLKSLITI